MSTLRRWVGLLLIGVAAGEPLTAAVTARWGGADGREMEVRGFDADGLLRLAPTDGSAGEARIRAEDVDGLLFELPAVLNEAKRRASVGRPAEAVFMLRHQLDEWVPYARMESSNVAAAVRFYLGLLTSQELWPEAIAVATALTRWPDELPLAHEILRLVHALQAAGRVEDAAWLLARIPQGVMQDRSPVRQAATVVAHELRAAGHWRHAEAVYSRLREASPAAASAGWDVLIAYCQWQQGSPLMAAAWVNNFKPDRATLGQHEGLNGLLSGLVWLEKGAHARALDVLGQTLLNTTAASEWRFEITRTLAQAYRLSGYTRQADLIEADLARLRPVNS